MLCCVEEKDEGKDYYINSNSMYYTMTSPSIDDVYLTDDHGDVPATILFPPYECNDSIQALRMKQCLIT
jgi:hypothetical protein